MKALTIRQPHACAIALGFKLCETRPGRTHHRGPLAIHAAMFTPVEYMRVIRTAPIAQQEAIVAAGYHVGGKPSLVKMPTAAVVAIADVVDCIAVENLEEFYPEIMYPPRGERHWGDYTAGRFGWILSNVRRLAKPIEVKGAQGLWNWAAPADLTFIN